MYDEFVLAAAAAAGVDPIAIPENRSGAILKDLTAEQPRSVILTGTAGDGKTYTARKVLEALSGVNRHAILTPYRRPKMTPLERSGSWPDAV